MKRLPFALTILCIALTACPFTAKASPYYFVAIHCDPPVVRTMEANYQTLRQMVHKANQCNIKLTLMFTAPWAKYVMQSVQRMTEVRIWKSQGHEIAAHHHGLSHGIWDGYTDEDPGYAAQCRSDKGIDTPEQYNGTLHDLMRDLRPLGAPITSGCMNDEEDKEELPAEIIYDTCGGYANFGVPGRRVSISNTSESMKGINAYLTAGWWDGILRRWIAHYRVTNLQEQQKARNVFETLPEYVVYGVKFHALQPQAPAFNAYLDFLSGQDPGGWKSLTVRELVEGGILPEQVLEIDRFPE